MKRIVLLTLSFALVGCLLGSLAAAETLESDLQNLLEQFVSAWDKSDSQAIAALFEDDSDLVIPSGLLVEGRTGIEKFYASTFEHGYRGSRVSASIKHTRRISSDMVMVDGEWRIDGALVDGHAEAAEVGVFSLIARQRGGRWVICSLREQDGAHRLTRFADGRPLDGPAPPSLQASVGGERQFGVRFVQLNSSATSDRRNDLGSLRQSCNYRTNKVPMKEDA